MTCLLTIIAINFWFVKPVVKFGSQIAIANWTNRLVPFIQSIVWSIEAASTFSSKSSSSSLGISKTILFWKKKMFVHSHPFESYWLFPHGLVIFPWDRVLKENPYFATPLSRSPHNGTSFTASVWSSLQHVSLPSSSHISSFDCIWSVLL